LSFEFLWHTKHSIVPTDTEALQAQDPALLSVSIDKRLFILEILIRRVSAGNNTCMIFTTPDP
jgi:hypothetical protein